jgi:hypothetical protein
MSLAELDERIHIAFDFICHVNGGRFVTSPRVSSLQKIAGVEAHVLESNTPGMLLQVQ